MMNWTVLQDLARERSRDMIDDATRNRRHPARERNLPAAEQVYLYGRSALVINARVRAQASPRLATVAFDLP